MNQIITPFELTIRKVFKQNISFHIDIYQREYKWRQSHVTTLLNDIQIRFLAHERKKQEPGDIKKDILENFDQYYLNTFLTHSPGGVTSIVDGQQRLTTILLILIKIYRILKAVEADATVTEKPFASSVLAALIFEENDQGGVARFKIYNKNREAAFLAVLHDIPAFTPKDETQQRIYDNYSTVSEYFDTFLRDEATGSIDFQKLTYYLYYFLDHISIVEIKIEKQKSVAMIFEVVNDRGEKLTPAEILKGKIIGGLPQVEKEEANHIWIDHQNRYFSAHIEGFTLDYFFQTYLRSKFADTSDEYAKFTDDKYHYALHENPRALASFKKFNDSSHLYRFVTNEFAYFSGVFLKIHHAAVDDYEHIAFNQINGQNQQYLLILSGLQLRDPQEEEKIKLISQKFDQFYTLLTLLNVYNSKDGQRYIHELNRLIRNQSLDGIRKAFDMQIVKALAEHEVIPTSDDFSAPDVLKFDYFKNVGGLSPDFGKYVLMRIDRHIARLHDIPSAVGGPLCEVVDRFKKGKKVYRFDLEHIITDHASNLAHFTDPETQEVEYADYHLVRNKLGMLLLLKDKHNKSSNNELYSGKLKTYQTSDLIWNRLLVGHLHGTDQKKIPAHWNPLVAEACEDGTFPLDKVNQRQRAVFELIKEVWAF